MSLGHQNFFPPVWLLQKNPMAMVRATQEARGVMAGASDITLEHLARLDYIDACINETMRLKPVAPQMPLQALKDTTLGDVDIPAGTVVIGVMRHDSVDDAFVADGQSFRPERWLGEDGLVAASAKRISMPFGAGPRMCPGRYLALQEMKMVLLTLLTSFDVKSVSTGHGGEPVERLMFAMAPVGLRMKLGISAGV